MLLEGNILAWNPDFIEFHATVLKNITLESLCDSKSTHLLMKEKSTFDEANQFCKVHGGILALPNSEEENEKLHGMLMENINTCYRIWIDYFGHNTSFSFFKKKSSIDTCAVMGEDSKWQGKQNIYCQYTRHCFICEFEKVPMMTLKGLCDITTYSFNYFFVSTYQYIGYVGGSITKQNGTWILKNVPNTEMAFFNTSGDHFIGRSNWVVQDTFCGLDNSLRQLTVSICKLSSEYTCNSGQCIPLTKRCDNLQDCEDNSDEEDCTIITPIEGYNLLEPPQLVNSLSNLFTTVEIVQFDEIDNMQSKLTLTLDITISWTEPRIIAKYLPEYDNTSTIFTEISGIYIFKIILIKSIHFYHSFKKILSFILQKSKWINIQINLNP